MQVSGRVFLHACPAPTPSAKHCHCLDCMPYIMGSMGRLYCLVITAAGDNMVNRSLKNLALLDVWCLNVVESVHMSYRPAVECYRPRQTTTTDNRRWQMPGSVTSLLVPLQPTLCVGGLANNKYSNSIHFLTNSLKMHYTKSHNSQSIPKSFSITGLLHRPHFSCYFWLCLGLSSAGFSMLENSKMHGDAQAYL